MSVIRNFVRYCKLYLSERCGLSEEQAQILVLDPDLGSDMDKTKTKWLDHDILPKFPHIDPDQFLVPPRFDAPEMERINTFLDKYAKEYPAREQKIKEYLKSIGHPLGD